MDIIVSIFFTVLCSYLVQMAFSCLVNIIFLVRAPRSLREFFKFTYLPYIIKNFDELKKSALR